MKQLERLIALFDELLRELGSELQIKYQVSIGEQFGDKDGKFYNNTKKLRSSKGGKSLKADLSKNSKVEVSAGQVKVTFSTDKPYAGIQNRGGFIKATPTKDKFGRDTYKMAQYFWYLHGKEDVARKKKIYKIMALSVQKRGGVRIKAKNYLENSVKDFENRHLEDVLQAFYLQILKIWNG